jgi:hypothetical protein
MWSHVVEGFDLDREIKTNNSEFNEFVSIMPFSKKQFCGINFWVQFLARRRFSKIFHGKLLITFWRDLELSKNSKYKNLELFK